jgi:hypothetical protein
MNIKKFTIWHSLRSKQDILSTLLQNCYLQMSQDICYAITSKIQRLLECTLNMLNEDRKNDF